MKVSSRVPPAFNGQSLIEYLAGRFSYLCESDWRQLIRQGRISCNQTLCGEDHILSRGDIIGCELPDFEAPAANFNYSTIYEDQWLLAINKPAGLRVHSGGRFFASNLIYHIREFRRPPCPEANLVNRLDADTSGLVLLAKDKDVLKDLMRQFAQGLVDKRYLALVKGCPSPAEGSIDLPIGPVKGAQVPRFGIDPAEGKPSITHYKTLRPIGKELTLLELHPETGRTHQLRVHLAAIGHPIVGDALYTLYDEDYLDWRRNPPRTSGLQRQALHSHQLRFYHPILKTHCTLLASLAADIEAIIKG